MISTIISHGLGLQDWCLRLQKVLETKPSDQIAMNLYRRLTNWKSRYPTGQTRIDQIFLYTLIINLKLIDNKLAIIKK